MTQFVYQKLKSHKYRCVEVNKGRSAEWMVVDAIRSLGGEFGKETFKVDCSFWYLLLIDQLCVSLTLLSYLLVIN